VAKPPTWFKLEEKPVANQCPHVGGLFLLVFIEILCKEYNHPMDANTFNTILSDPSKLNWLFLISLWALPWKGYALWKAAKNHQIAWFVGILLLNTAAILEIIYLAFFQKKNLKNEN